MRYLSGYSASLPPRVRPITVMNGMRLAPLTLACSAPWALGCAGMASGTAAEADAATTTSALVIVERTTGATEGSSAEGSARFVRVAASASVDDALRAIGAALELPARGSCGSAAPSVAGPLRREQAPVVELVDVGAVALEANGIETRLLPRQLPDVTDVVSGVVYARAAEASLLPAATKYVVRVAGGPDVGPFEFAATAPADPGLVRIVGEDRPGTIVTSGAPVMLNWASDASEDLVYADVRPAGIRCVFANAGRGALAAPLFDDAGTLVIHRLHREALHAVGIDSGEVRFDFSRTVAYTRR